MRDFEDRFFQEELGAAGQGRANGAIFTEFVFVNFQLAIKLRGKRAALVGPGGKVAAIQNRQAV